MALVILSPYKATLALDPLFDKVSMLMHMNGANNSTLFVDELGAAVSYYGSPKISTANSKFGGSALLLNGSSDYLTLPSSDLLTSWTIECWFFTTRAQQQTFISLNSGGILGVNIWHTASGTLVVDDGSHAQPAFTGGAITFATWNHLAVVKNNATTTVYLNGVAVGSNNFVPGGVSTIFIGRYNNPTSFYFGGYFDEIRVTNGFARYSSNFTPTSSAFPDS